MNLEELIYKRFSERKGLTRQLAVYNGYPAVFCPDSPEDDKPGWKEGIRYPQVIYNFDLQAVEERKSAGTLSVDVLFENTVDTVPEELEAEVKKCLADVLLTPDGGPPYAFAWARTDAFTIQDKKIPLVSGSEIRFDILEYSTQETTDPDPVEALNQYIKELCPECIVAGLDRMEQITEASEQTPVVYCRLISVEKNRETNTVVWMDGRTAVHILCPESSIRRKISAAVANQMALDGEIIMLDKSPMFIKRLQADYQSDYLKNGQIAATVHYGLLRYRAKPHSLKGMEGNYS